MDPQFECRQSGSKNWVTKRPWEELGNRTGEEDGGQAVQTTLKKRVCKFKGVKGKNRQDHIYNFQSSPLVYNGEQITWDQCGFRETW